MNNKNLQEILSSPGIDETLEDLIKGKVDCRRQIEKECAKCVQGLLSEQLKIDSADFWEIIIHYQLHRIDIDNIDKEINRLCFYLTDINNKKLPKGSLKIKGGWQAAMARLETISVVDVISNYVEVKTSKRLICCPLHNDGTASLKVYEDTNSFYCFGCMKGGAAVNFVMLMEDVDFKTAVKKLLNF